ncbi:MAG TPA: DUF5985 family protein [Azospirillaceae bacterium]|nr:DUF5985 family protein [Azospirillaceae bacterium]
MTLGAAIYLLCAATSLVCMLLLIRGYLKSRTRLLLLSALCFTGLFLNNMLLVVDLMILPHIDMRPFRTLTALASLTILLVGFIWETD